MTATKSKSAEIAGLESRIACLRAMLALNVTQATLREQGATDPIWDAVKLHCLSLPRGHYCRPRRVETPAEAVSNFIDFNAWQRYRAELEAELPRREQELADLQNAG